MLKSVALGWHMKHIFYWLFIHVEMNSASASGPFQTICQHENSSRNSILTTRTFRNWPKFRNYEKHDLSDKTASPASWGTLKLKNFAADAANLIDRDAGIDIRVTRRAYILYARRVIRGQQGARLIWNAKGQIRTVCQQNGNLMETNNLFELYIIFPDIGDPDLQF